MRAKMAFSWEQNCLRRCVFSSGMICSRNLRKTSSMCCLDMNYIKKNSLSSAIIQAVFRYGSHLVLRSDFLLLRRRLVYNHGYHQHASGILEYWVWVFLAFVCKRSVYNMVYHMVRSAVSRGSLTQVKYYLKEITDISISKFSDPSVIFSMKNKHYLFLF